MKKTLLAIRLAAITSALVVWAGVLLAIYHVLNN